MVSNMPRRETGRLFRKDLNDSQKQTTFISITISLFQMYNAFSVYCLYFSQKTKKFTEHDICTVAPAFRIGVELSNFSVSLITGTDRKSVTFRYYVFSEIRRLFVGTP